MKHEITPLQRARARRLRAEPTWFERRMWALLRERLPWAKFRRQAPVAGFVADFLCAEARLIVELDGQQHGLPDGAERDAARDARLRAEGFTVLRLWNGTVADEPEAGVETVIGALAAAGVAAPAVGAPAGRGFRGRGRRFEDGEG